MARSTALLLNGLWRASTMAMSRNRPAHSSDPGGHVPNALANAVEGYPWDLIPNKLLRSKS